jgi:hypothetical protein
VPVIASHMLYCPMCIFKFHITHITWHFTPPPPPPPPIYMSVNWLPFQHCISTNSFNSIWHWDNNTCLL